MSNYYKIFLLLIILFVGVYFIALITPKLAAFIDRRRKNSPGEEPPEAPRPERVQSDDNEQKTDVGSDDI